MDLSVMDELSMADNNSSAFFFRPNANTPNLFSHHAYGIAVDINPLQNPFYKPTTNVVAPANGREFLERKPHRKGMIDRGDACYCAFVSRGFEWGGDWDPQDELGRIDYQHFARPLTSMGSKETV
jgi:hypothetical protein